MRSNTPRGVPLHDVLPYRNSDKTPSGVSVNEQIEYRGASIKIFCRDIGIAGKRLAYTARIDNPETAESRYLGYHSKKEALIENAKQWVDTTVKPEKPKFIKMVSRQRAWELWFDGEEKNVK